MFYNKKFRIKEVFEFENDKLTNINYKIQVKKFLFWFDYKIPIIYAVDFYKGYYGLIYYNILSSSKKIAEKLLEEFKYRYVYKKQKIIKALYKFNGFSNSLFDCKYVNLSNVEGYYFKDKYYYAYDSLEKIKCNINRKTFS